MPHGPGIDRASEERFLDDVRKSLDDGGDGASAVRQLFDWSDGRGLHREFAEKSRGPQCLIKLPRPRGGITLLHIEAGGAFTWLGMQWLRNHPPFDQEAVQGELEATIRTLPDGCYFFHASGIRGQPSFDLSALAATDRVSALIRILGRMTEQWLAHHPE